MVDQDVKGFHRKAYGYYRNGKWVRCPATEVPDYNREDRGKGKKMKVKKLVKYKPRKREVDAYGQYY